VRKTLFVLAPLLCAAPAFAQVSVEVSAPPPPRIVVAAPPPPSIEVAPPAVRFSAPPPMVEVSPGVRVVRDCDEEVFFHHGYYWHPGAHGAWFRTRSYRGGWVMAPRAAVPMALVRLPPGHYRHFHGGGPRMRAERRFERHEAHVEHRMERHQAHAERRFARRHGG
jgi:hypothetical protein